MEAAGRSWEKHRLHVAGSAPDREHPDIVGHRLADEFGEVNIYLLACLRASHVRELFPEQDILTCQDAYKALIEREKIDPEKRNVLVAHQFFTYGANGPVRCESESFSAGGLDAADVRTIFGGEEALFDYVALGHLHAPQSVGRKYIRYSGSPLKYSVSESGQRKSMTVVELGEKGNVALREIPFLPLRDVRLLEGTLARLTDPATVKNGNAEDYVSVILTDEEELYDLADLFKVFADSTRIRILFVLFESEVCVCDLAKVLNMTQSAVSHQLRILKQNKLVKARRDGKSIFYSLADDHVRTIISMGREHILE